MTTNSDGYAGESPETRPESVDEQRWSTRSCARSGAEHLVAVRGDVRAILGELGIGEDDLTT